MFFDRLTPIVEKKLLNSLAIVFGSVSIVPREFEIVK